MDKQPPKHKPPTIDGFFSPKPRRPQHTPRTHLAKRTPYPTRIDNDKPVNPPSPSYLRPAPQLDRLAQPTVGLNAKSIRPRLSGQKQSRLVWRRIAAGGVALVFIIMVTTTTWLGIKFLKDVSKVFGGSIASNIGDLFSSATLKGESQGRVNILLAGDSADDPGHQGANLTDSIMVVSIDTKNNTGFLLSIPRDLWVNIPTLGQQKINAANTVNNFSAAGLPSGGMGQLQQIVQNDLGIPIDYYALIDYTAFRDAVNAIGGITININSSDPRGLYDPGLLPPLPNGPATLNGQLALDLARARGDQYGSYGFPASDFDRTQNQREMLVALKTKATTLGVVTNPVKIGQLFDAVGNNVVTNLKLSDVLRLVQITKGISNSAIQSLSYSETGTKPLIMGYTAPDGEDALIPVAGPNNFTQLQAYYQQLTSNNPVVKEDANVVILNGTNTSGLAQAAQNKLITKGLDVSAIADASKTYPATTIIDNSKGKKPATLSLLKTVYGNNVTTQQLETYPTNPDFIVILGQNDVPVSNSSSSNNNQ